MRNFLVILSVLFFGLYSCQEQPKANDANVRSKENGAKVQPKGDETYIMQLQSQVNTVKQQLPTDMGGIFYFDIELDKEARILTHSYQYVNNPQVTDEQIESMKKDMISMIKASPSDRMPIDNGFAMRFNYFSNNKELLFTVTITPNDL